MKNTYTYDDLYGTLLHKNEDDTERTYFIIGCLTSRFRRWMFVEGWNKGSEKEFYYNNIKGYKITFKRKDTNNANN